MSKLERALEEMLWHMIIMHTGPKERCQLEQRGMKREQWEMLWHMMLETRGMKGNKVAHDANEGRQQS